MFKQIKSFIILFIIGILLLMLPLIAEAAIVEQGTCGTNLTWTLDDTGTLTISGIGDMDDYATTNNAPWSSYRDSITNIVIGNQVTSIGSNSFYGTKITGITIPGSVIRIGNGAFYSSYKMTNISIANGLNSIGSQAFKYCALTSVTIPDSVTYIGDEAFNWCRDLLSIKLPFGLKNIGKECFYYCTSLNNVIFPNDLVNIEERAFNSCYNLTNITIPNGVKIIGDSAFTSCGLTSLDIPSNVISIGEKAFYGCKFSSVTIPASVISIGNQAFDCLINVNSQNTAYSSIDGVLFDKYKRTLLHYPKGKGASYKIPDGVVSIGEFAFRGNRDIENVILPDSVTSIGNNAFELCEELSNLMLSDNLISIGNEAFYDCRYLIDVILPRSLYNIGNFAFSGCNSLRSITIPASVTNIGYGAFHNCDMLPGIDVDPNNTIYSSVDGVLFNKSQDLLISYPIARARTAYTIPSTVTRIGEGAFSGGFSGSLRRIDIPDSVKSIDRWAFSINQSTAIVVIPKNVRTIDEYAFDYGSNMTLWVEPESTALEYAEFKNLSYRIKGEQHEGTLGGLTWTLTLDDIATLTISGTGEMIEPGETEAWRPYSAYIKSIIINNGVTSIAENAFSNCAGLTSISIPASMTSIGDWAFGECPSLTEFIIDSGNTTFSAVDGILYNKTGNTLLYYPEGKSANCIIPNGTTNIANGAFKRHFNLKTVTIPGSVISIGDEAFSWCNYLTSAELSEGLISIGVDAFSPCLSLENMVIPATVTNIGEGAFTNCRKLHSITIPSKVESISAWTFAHCYELSNVTIPTSVTNIGNKALGYCYGLTDIWYQGTEEQWTGITKAEDWNESVPENVTVHFIDVAIIESGSWGDGFIYCLDGNGELTISGTGPMPTEGKPWNSYDRRIKSVKVGYGITSVSNNAFAYLPNLTSATLADTVLMIGDCAFSYCYSLSSIVMPANVTSIGDCAFRLCRELSSIVFPASLSHIGNFAFTFCNTLSTITPDNVMMTEHTKYYEDSLYVFSLPATVTEIGYGAFIGTDIGQHASFNADFKIPSMITNIEEEAFMGIKATHILLKPQNGNKVTIGKNAFANCSQLCYFEYNNGYYAAEMEIDPDAFSGCSSLTLIGRYNEELEQYAQGHGFEYMENEFYGGDG